MTALQAVLLDMDGTLMDTEPLFLALMRETTVALLGRTISTAQARSYIGPPLHHSMLELAGGDQQLAAQLLSDYRRRYAATHTAIAPFPGVVQMLKELKAAGLRLAVATSKPQDRAVALLQHHGLAALFEVVAGAPAAEGQGSQKDLVVGRALNALAISRPASETLMVGDRIFDIEGARVHGVRTILAAWSGLADATEARAAWRVADTPAAAAQVILQEAQA